jgi:hypothetical protein
MPNNQTKMKVYYIVFSQNFSSSLNIRLVQLFAINSTGTCGTKITTSLQRETFWRAFVVNIMVHILGSNQFVFLKLRIICFSVIRM